MIIAIGRISLRACVLRPVAKDGGALGWHLPKASGSNPPGPNTCGVRYSSCSKVSLYLKHLVMSIFSFWKRKNLTWHLTSQPADAGHATSFPPYVQRSMSSGCCAALQALSDTRTTSRQQSMYKYTTSVQYTCTALFDALLYCWCDCAAPLADATSLSPPQPLLLSPCLPADQQTTLGTP